MKNSVQAETFKQAKRVYAEAGRVYGEAGLVYREAERVYSAVATDDDPTWLEPETMSTRPGLCPTCGAPTER